MVFVLETILGMGPKVALYGTGYCVGPSNIRGGAKITVNEADLAKVKVGLGKKSPTKWLKEQQDWDATDYFGGIGWYILVSDEQVNVVSEALNSEFGLEREEEN
ncbi:MAG: hypothetical protein ABII21_01045 [bacterium]